MPHVLWMRVRRTSLHTLFHEKLCVRSTGATASPFAFAYSCTGRCVTSCSSGVRMLSFGQPSELICSHWPRMRHPNLRDARNPFTHRFGRPGWAQSTNASSRLATIRPWASKQRRSVCLFCSASVTARTLGDSPLGLGSAGLVVSSSA
jgi:hypothetical protein